MKALINVKMSYSWMCILNFMKKSCPSNYSTYYYNSIQNPNGWLFNYIQVYKIKPSKFKKEYKKIPARDG